MSLREIWRATREWSRKETPWGEAILLSVRRSAPRLPGARFAAAMDGSTAGTISAGCVEADLQEHVLRAVRDGAPRIVEYGITDEMALGVGLSCGGEISVLVRPHDPGDPVSAAIDELLTRDASGALLTGVSDEVQGRRMLVTRDGSRLGALSGLIPDGGELGFDRLTRREGSRLLTVGDDVVVFLDPVLTPRRLVIVGGTAVSRALVPMAAAAGFNVVLVDPREQLSRSEDFPDATVVREWPGDALSRLDLDPWTAVAVLAHDPRLDVPALDAAMAAGCQYVGLLGGARTQRLRRQALSDAGFASADLDRIRGPIGLDIGAATPVEIAVAILAEVLAVRRGASMGER